LRRPKRLWWQQTSAGKCYKPNRREQRFRSGPHANELYAIAEQSSLILIPDYSPIVKIPLTRAPLGKTKFLLTLNRGVLTDYHAEHPSTTLEIVKVPLNVSEAIIKLPTEILQLKIDYSSKAQALVEQQAKYQDTLKAIAEKTEGPSTYDEQVKALEQEKAILQLQKEIAELKPRSRNSSLRKRPLLLLNSFVWRKRFRSGLQCRNSGARGYRAFITKLSNFLRFVKG